MTFQSKLGTYGCFIQSDDLRTKIDGVLQMAHGFLRAGG